PTWPITGWWLSGEEEEERERLSAGWLDAGEGEAEVGASACLYGVGQKEWETLFWTQRPALGGRTLPSHISHPCHFAH
ncbi:hypothetical protein RTBOTA2_006838, partial [Rhodotorula toruloides]